MALRAGYYGLKRVIKDKLLNLANAAPADIGPDNPIAGKNDVLATVDLLKDTTGWTGKNRFNILQPNSVTGGALSAITNGIKLLANSATNYANARYYMDFEQNETYHIKYNATNIANGVNMVQIKGSNDNVNFTLIKQFNGDTSYDDSFNSGEYTYYTMQLFFTGESGASGDGVEYTNFMVCTKAQYDLSPSFEPYHESVAEMLDGKLSIGSMLTSADDLNDIKTSGIYAFSTSPANTPEGVVYGTLIVEGNSSGSTGVRQLIIVSGASSGIIYTRGYDGSPQTWKSWFKFTGTEVTPPSPTPESETKKATKKKVIKEEEE